MRNAYDAAGRLVQTIDAKGNVTANAYEPSGNLLSVTDALGNLTRYQYDDQNGPRGAPLTIVTSAPPSVPKTSA